MSTVPTSVANELGSALWYMLQMIEMSSESRTYIDSVLN